MKQEQQSHPWLTARTPVRVNEYPIEEKNGVKRDNGSDPTKSTMKTTHSAKLYQRAARKGVTQIRGSNFPTASQTLKVTNAQKETNYVSSLSFRIYSPLSA